MTRAASDSRKRNRVPRRRAAAVAVGRRPTAKARGTAANAVTTGAVRSGGGGGGSGGGGTTISRVARAAGPPLQWAVLPVKTRAVEQPSSSVTVSVTVYVPGLA